MKGNSFLVFSVCVVSIIIIVVNQKHVNSLKITNMGFYNKNNISSLRLLFKTVSSLCISSGSGETLNGLIELFKKDYKTVVFYDYTIPLHPCVGVFIVDTNNYTTQECEGFVDSKQTTALYLVQDSATADSYHSLEACLSDAQTQEVLTLSLSDSSLLQLSPVFPRPRHFVSTSVSEVLQRRVQKSEKPNLQGSPLTVGTLYHIPFFINSTSSNEENGGLYVELVKELGRQLNFSSRYVMYKQFGIGLNNGTWTGNGLLQAVQEGSIDIVATNMWQVPEFYKVMDFGPTLNKAKLGFIVLRPEMLDFQWQAILHIFKPKVWFAIFVSFVLSVVVYWAGLNWDPRPYTESWSGCILLMFGYFTGCTSHSRVDEGNTRFSLTSWSVFSLLITTSLSTGVVTRLTIPFYSPRINTVEQLVKGKYTWTAQFYALFFNNTLLRETLFDLKNHWIQLFEKRYVYMDDDEVVKNAGTDKKLTFVVEAFGKDFVVMETDGLDGHEVLNNYRVSREAFKEGHVTFGLKKQSVLLEPSTKLTLYILQAGLMTHWKEEVIRRWPQYNTRHLLIELDIPTFREPQSLPLYKVKPVFYLLAFGLGLASLVFFIEICW